MIGCAGEPLVRPTSTCEELAQAVCEHRQRCEALTIAMSECVSALTETCGVTFCSQRTASGEAAIPETTLARCREGITAAGCDETQLFDGCPSPPECETPPPPPSPVPTDPAIRKGIEAVLGAQQGLCELQQTCCGADLDCERFDDVDAFAGDVMEELGGVVVDNNAATRCLAAVPTACEDLTLALFGGGTCREEEGHFRCSGTGGAGPLDSCGLIFRGNRAPGAACRDHRDCQPGFFCPEGALLFRPRRPGEPAPEPEPPPTCTATRPDGAACESHDECQNTASVCNAGKCGPRPALGQPCSMGDRVCNSEGCWTGTCRPGGHCDQGVCVALSGEGAPCTLDDNPCAFGLRCDFGSDFSAATGTCTALPPDHQIGCPASSAVARPRPVEPN